MDSHSTINPDAAPDPRSLDGSVFAQDIDRIRLGIVSATDEAGLQRAAAEIRALMHRLVGEVPAEACTRLISRLNDALTRRMIELTCADARMPAARWCWIALGSEGREEQTLSTDQDNGIIMAGRDGAEGLRERLLPLALRINEALDACGFPLCTGKIMASNPQWCLDLHEWRERFASWIIDGDPQALLNATIFFDLRALFGAHDLAAALADWLAEIGADSPRFLFQMTENALRRKPPLGVLHDFVVEKGGMFAGTIDLKRDAATLFVDAARIYGLACGARTSNTADRLRLAADAGRLRPTDVQAWIGAFYFIQMLRLKNQQSHFEQGSIMHNHVDPNELGGAERRELLNALREARALQRRLALEYLGTSQGI